MNDDGVDPIIWLYAALGWCLVMLSMSGATIRIVWE